MYCFINKKFKYLDKINSFQSHLAVKSFTTYKKYKKEGFISLRWSKAIFDYFSYQKLNI